MKNTLSKTLICGVIASSFILVNCQKAPSSRGVKGTKGSSETAAEKAAAESAKSYVVKCSADFLDEYKIWNKSILAEEKKVKGLKKEDLTDSIKAELETAVKRLDKETKNVRLELDKLQESENKTALEKKVEKKIIDGCFAGEGKDRVEYTTVKIEQSVNFVAKKVAELTGSETDRSKKGKEDEENYLAKSDVTKNAKFYVTAELNAALDESKIEESYFLLGKVLSGKANLDKVIEDKTSSVCVVKETKGKIEDLANTLDALETNELEKTNGKTKHEIAMVSKGNTYLLNCFIPTKKKLGEAFRSAMGGLLMTKEQKERKDKKALADNETADTNEDKARKEKADRVKAEAEAAKTAKKTKAELEVDKKVADKKKSVEEAVKKAAEKVAADQKAKTDGAAKEKAAQEKAAQDAQDPKDKEDQEILNKLAEAGVA